MQFTEQQLKALDLERNIIVTAGAGSGKTTVLVERYVRILLERKEHPAHILAITFTEKAAAEMKNRVVERLQTELQKGTHPQRAFELLAATPEMHISTIHAFCHRLLRKYANLVNLDPEFDVADDLTISEIQELVFNRFFNQDALPFDAQTRPLVEQAIEYFSIDKIQNLFKSVYAHRLQLLPHLHHMQSRQVPDLLLQWEQIKQHRITEFVQALLRHPAMVQLQRAPLPEGKANYQKKLRAFLQYLQNAKKIDPGEMFAQFRGLLTQKGKLTHRVKSYLLRSNVWDEETVENFTQFLAEAQDQLPLIFDDSDVEMRETLAGIQLGTAHLIGQLLKETKREKQRRQLLDFSDLLWFTYTLIKENPPVRKELQQQYRWLLIDEFQDTDRLQAEMVRLLHQPIDSRVPAPNLFLVGDPKQSIYGFRDADVRIFREFETEISRQNTQGLPFTAPHGTELPSTERERSGLIVLPHNFRSLPPLVSFFNHVFKPIFEGRNEYEVLLEPLEAAREASTLARIHILHFQHLAETSADPDILYRRAIPELIYQLVSETSYSFGDIAILLQTRTHLTEVEEALQRTHIPYEVYKGVGFFQNQEVLDMFHLLRAVENPSNNRALWAALRTPYAGVSDAVLFVLAQVKGHTVMDRIATLLQAAETNDWNSLALPPWLPPDAVRSVCTPDQLQALRYFHRQITELAAATDPHQFSRLLQEILIRFGVKAVLHHTFRGDQKLANIEKFIQYVYDFQRRPGSTLTDLLRAFDRQIRHVDQEGEAVVYLEGGNRVQIMTIHAAKGLEFPVVILPHLNQQMINRESVWVTDQGMLFPPDSSGKEKNFFITQWFQNQNRLKLEAEHKRLFYVAATRARDHLYLFSLQGNRNNSFSFHKLLWENALGLDDIPENPPLPAWVTTLPEVSVKVCTYHPEEWEAFTPPPSRESSGPSGAGELSPGARYWQSLAPSQPPRVYSATQLMLFQENPTFFFDQFFLNRYQLFPPMLALEDADEPDPTGISWGILVHRLLENFHARSVEADGEAIHRVLQETPVDSNALEIYQRDLSNLMSRFRQHPLAVEIQESPTALAEYTLQVPVDERHTLLGKLDYLYRRVDGNWAIVDFKTNRVDRKGVDSLTQKYALQMAVYAFLVHHLFPDQKTIPVGLFFLQPMEIRWVEYTPQHLEATHNTILDLMQRLDCFFEETFSTIR